MYTDSIMDPHFHTNDKFKFPPKFEEKKTLDKPKKFKHYSEFTKMFDKVTYK